MLVLKTTNTVRVVVKSKGEDIQPIAIGDIVEPAFDGILSPMEVEGMVELLR